MRQIYIYLKFESWMNEKPDAEFKGRVVKHDGKIVEISDDQGYTQLINMDNIFSIVW